MSRNISIIAGMLFTAVSGISISGCVSVQPVTSQASVEPLDGLVLDVDAPLTVDAAVRHVLASDPELRALRHRISAAYWQKVQSSLPANPELSVSVDPTEWALKLTAHIADMVGLGGRREAMVAVGQSREEQAVLSLMLGEIDAARQVRYDFAETWARRRARELMQDRVDLLGEIADIGRRQVELGELSGLDVLRLERRQREANMDLKEQILLLRQSQARLNRRLGQPLNAELAVAMPTADSFWTDTALRDGEQAELGLLRRPELAVLAAEVREQRAMLKVARVQWLDGIEAGPYLTSEGDRRVGGGEFAIAVPVFDRGQAVAGAHRSELAALEEQMLAAQATLLLEIHQAMLRLHYALDRQASDLQAIHNSAVAEYELLRQAQRLGEASEIDTRVARLAALDSEIAVQMAQLAEWHARTDMAAALGDRGEPIQEGIPHGEDR